MIFRNHKKKIKSNHIEKHHQTHSSMNKLITWLVTVEGMIILEKAKLASEKLRLLACQVGLITKILKKVLKKF
jgi:hypothetical protein